MNVRHHNGNEMPHQCYSHLTKKELADRINEVERIITKYKADPPNYNYHDYLAELEIRLDDLKIDLKRK